MRTRRDPVPQISARRDDAGRRPPCRGGPRPRAAPRATRQQGRCPSRNDPSAWRTTTGRGGVRHQHGRTAVLSGCRHRTWNLIPRRFQVALWHGRDTSKVEPPRYKKNLRGVAAEVQVLPTGRALPSRGRWSRSVADLAAHDVAEQFPSLALEAHQLQLLDQVEVGGRGIDLDARQQRVPDCRSP